MSNMHQYNAPTLPGSPRTLNLVCLGSVATMSPVCQGSTGVDRGSWFCLPRLYSGVSA